MALTIIITDAGRAALVNATNSGTAPVAITAAGFSAQAIAANAAVTSIPAEIKRLGTLSGDVVAADTIHLTVRDESADTYTVRTIALYLEDGTLFAVYSQAGALIEKSEQALLLLAVDVRFADITAASLTFGDTDFLNPPGTTERQGVVELATDAETAAGTDSVRAVTPKGIKAAVTGWLDARFGAGAPSTFVKSLLTAASAAAFRTALAIKSAALKDEGAGNGLDADLLDGQQGSYYTNIPGRLGYTPANKAGETFTGGIAATDINISQGDLFISRTSHAWGYIVRPNVAGCRNLGFSTAGDAALLDNVNFNAVNVTIRGLTVWNAGNDGPGSGLDADLLDGQDGGFYANIPARLGYTPMNRAGDEMSGNLNIRNSGPTIVLRDTDNYSSMIHCNDGMFYVLRGEPDSANWTMLGGTWPLSINLSNNNASLGGTVTAAGNFYARAGSLVWDAGNDGAGSGLDADLLDGQQGSFYTDIVGRLGFWPVRQGGGIGQSTNVVYIGWSGTRLKAQVDATDQGNIVFDGHISDVWRASNDGSGSGLDADLLDGWQRDDIRRWGNLLDRPGSFPPDAHQHGANDIETAFYNRNLAAAGYQVLPGGLILQWCTAAWGVGEVTVGVNFPIVFPTACLSAQVCGQVNSYAVENDMWYLLVGDPSTSGCILNRAWSDSSTNHNSTARIFAIGY